MRENILKYFDGDELATDVIIDKYLTKVEVHPDEMHLRMAKEFARAEINTKDDMTNHKELSKFGIDFHIEYEDLNEEELTERYMGLFKDFKYIVPQGSIMSTLGTDTIASLSNCWVVESPHDSYGGILKTDGELVYKYKRRGGVGTDLSRLRPRGTKTKNSAKSTTGAVSFMHRYSNTTREVAQAGRRGALMLSIDISHPDSMEFIKVKRDGVSVTGANISLRLNKEFMEAVKANEDYILRFPCDNKFTEGVSPVIDEYDKLVEYSPGMYLKKIKAKEYWDEIIHSAKNYAEPGLMYWDNVIDFDPASVYPEYTPTSSNPCGEQFLNPNDSCRLMALNLYSFVDKPFTDGSEINYDKLYKVSYEHARMGDNLVTLELEYIQRIIDKIKSDPEPDDVKRGELEMWIKSYEKTEAGRRVGLGITSLADMVAALGLGYDSEEGMEVISKVMKTKMKAEIDCNVDLAITRGPFTGWDPDLEFKNRHHGVFKGKNKFYDMIVNEFPDEAKDMHDFGRRSVSWSTIAPTGSVSILTQTTSGCEPLFMPFYMRRKKINSNEAEDRVDFVDELGDNWQEFPVLHEKFKQWINANFNKLGLSGQQDIEVEMSKEDLQKAFEQSPWFGSTANDIDWIKRNEIQAILQKYTTNAISSTINLPSTVTEQEVSDIYMSGWKMGLKGQTVYVDGSRSGVLVDNSKKEVPEGEFTYMDSVERPQELEADIHTTTSNGKKYNVFIGLLYDKPYEVFISEHFTNKKHMSILKVGEGRYDLIHNEEVYSEDFTSDMLDEEVAITRAVSLSLRHRIDVKHIVDQLDKTPSKSMFSFSKSLTRILRKYIPDGTESGVKCNDCNSKNVIFEEGCHKCLDCGSSACG